MLLVGKYQQELKKKGLQLSEENASFTLGLLKRIIDEVNRLTQDEHNDNSVQETGISKAVFMNLEAFVSQLEAEATKNVKRPTLMRKNSLKKIEELPTIRPSSRGKLSSLSKRDSGLGKQEILGISKSKIESA